MAFDLTALTRAQAQASLDEKPANAPRSHLTYYPTDNGPGSVLQFDVLSSEDITLESEITEYPVEKGCKPVDHIRPKPDGVHVEGVITNTPVGQRTLEWSVGEGGRLVATDPSPVTARPAEDARDVLTRIKNESMLLDLYLGSSPNGREYKSYGMASCSMHRDKNTGDALHFNATFKKVIIVESQTVAPPSAGAPSKDLGKQAAKPATPAQEQQYGGFLHDNVPH